MSSNVLLLGGTGYVGEALREILRRNGHVVSLLARSDRDVERLRDAGFDTRLGDVLDYGSLLKAMRGVDTVINLVAIIRERGEITFDRLNYQGTVNAVDAASETGVQRFIQMSALGVGNLPDFPYLFTKWRAENYVRDSALDWTILRPSIVFGQSDEGHEQFLGQVADLVRDAPVIPIPGDGRAPFQPIDRGDLAACFAAVVDDRESVGQTLELGGPDVITYEQMVDEVASVLNVEKRKIRVPTWVLETGAALLEKLPVIESPASVDQLRMLRIENVTSENGAERLIGHPLTPLRGNIDYVAAD